ncbi:MAG: hypothetical protein ACHQ9S_26825 [Candidatus Binatia bacterium]
MMPPHHRPDPQGGSRSYDRTAKRDDLSAEAQHLSPAAARALFQRELEYYRADMAYLPVQKAAERCLKLSVLLTVAVAVDGAATPTLH